MVNAAIGTRLRLSLPLRCSLLQPVFSKGKAREVYGRFGERPLLRRVTAVAAAYAIALASLIASFGAVRAAVADAPSLGIIICQRTELGQTAPAGDHGDCGSSCCVGCLLLLAAVPPPPTASIAVERLRGRRLTVLAILDLSSGPQTKSHRSRAPPVAA